MLIVALLLAAVGVGAGLARWTGVHPLAAGLVVGLPLGAIGFMIAASATSPTALGLGGLGWIVGAAFGSLGAFAG